MRGGSDGNDRSMVGEKIFLHKLLTKATRKVRIKREHTVQQIDYDSSLFQIKIQLG